MCVCAYIGTHHSNPPPHNHQPTSWASYPWSLGVLCAHLEWLGWVLPFIAGLGATAHIPAAALSLSTQSRPAHFSTHYHLSRRFLVTWPWDHYPAINFQATFTSFHQTFIHNIDFCTHVHPTWSPPPTHATQHLWSTNPPPPSTFSDFDLGFDHPLGGPTSDIAHPPCCGLGQLPHLWGPCYLHCMSAPFQPFLSINLAKLFICWGASKKPFLCCLLGDTQDLFRSFLCLCSKSSSRHT